MIDSSEHFTDATKMIGFDLERARGLRDFLQDDCAEVGDVWAEMIAEIERLRADNAGLSKAVISIQEERDLAQAEFRAYHKAWEEQAAEIERLRPFEIAARYLDSDLTKIAGERDDQAARIQDLEDALVEERARALWFEGDDPCDPPNLDWKTEPNDIPESVRLLWGESARQQLQAEGKIGPDVMPRSWQITEERKEAFGRILRRLEYDQSLPGHTNYKIQRAMELLRAMLEGAGQ